MNEIIEAPVAERYEQCMALIDHHGQQAVASTMEMWNAMLEIYMRKLWRARFHTLGEWLEYIGELGYTGMGRANIYNKLAQMQTLMGQGVRQEIAAAAVTAVPGAVRLIGSPAEFRAAVKDADPNEYVKSLSFMRSGEAITKVREDKGNLVEMWIKEVRPGVIPGEVLMLVVRSDASGYTAYDVKAVISPQIPGNQDLIGPVTSWFVNKVGGRNAQSKIK